MALVQNLRFAIRTLARSRSFTTLAVLILGLGIAGATTIFSVVKPVLLEPLAYRQPDRLVRVWNQWEGWPEGPLSPAEFLDYSERLTAFTHFGGYAFGSANLTGDSGPEYLDAVFLSAGVLPALGVEPLLGRFPSAAEDRPGAEPVALLSHGLWIRRFGADEAVIGRTVTLDGSGHTIIGVMPPDFHMPEALETGELGDLFVPLGFDRSTVPNRGSHFLLGVGRLAPGATVATARQEVEQVAAGFVRENPDDYPADMRFTATALPLHEDLVGPLRPAMLLLLGAVVFLLLIACANVASLLLSRADLRRREFGVRTALGAGRRQVLSQLVTESALLGLAGGALGVGLTSLTLPLVVHLQPLALLEIRPPRLDGGVLAFAIVLSFLTSLIFGLAPALQTARRDVRTILQDGARGSTAGRSRQAHQAGLVVVQVSLAVLLLWGAGLLGRTLLELQRVDPGYRTDGILTMRLALPNAGYEEDAEIIGFYEELMRRAASVTGVEFVGAVTNVPLATSLGDLNFQIEGRRTPEGAVSPRADWQAVTPGYFDALGIQLLRGRGITSSDQADAPGAAVINEALAQLHWPDENPLGQRIELGGGAGPGWVTVVGVARDIRHSALDAAPKPEMYLPHAQFRFWDDGPASRNMTIVARTNGEPLALRNGLLREIRALDPALPVASIATMDEIRAGTVARPRFLSTLLGLFSAVALLLAAVGTYAMLTFNVSRRLYEIGVRMALGARDSAVAGQVIGRGMALVGAGVVFGTLLAVAMQGWVRSELYGVAPADPITALTVAAVVAGAGLLASYLSASKATRVDPMVVLRTD